MIDSLPPSSYFPFATAPSDEVEKYARDTFKALRALGKVLAKDGLSYGLMKPTIDIFWPAVIGCQNYFQPNHLKIVSGDVIEDLIREDCDMQLSQTYDLFPKDLQAMLSREEFTARHASRVKGPSLQLFLLSGDRAVGHYHGQDQTAYVSSGHYIAVVYGAKKPSQVVVGCHELAHRWLDMTSPERTALLTDSGLEELFCTSVQKTFADFVFKDSRENPLLRLNAARESMARILPGLLDPDLLHDYHHRAMECMVKWVFPTYFDKFPDGK